MAGPARTNCGGQLSQGMGVLVLLAGILCAAPLWADDPPPPSLTFSEAPPAHRMADGGWPMADLPSQPKGLPAQAPIPNSPATIHNLQAAIATIRHPPSVQQASGELATGSGILPVSCPSCGTGGGLLGHRSGGNGPTDISPSGTGPNCGCGSFCTGCRLRCVPGQKPCPCGDHDCEGKGILKGTYAGRFLTCLYEAICCPDHCYDPQWTPVADAAFFVNAVRPQTQTRLRWDAGTNWVLPDRAEYFWARADGMGKGPKPNAGYLVANHVRYHDINFYTEGATGNVGVIVDMTYRSVDPVGAAHGAGFGDMKVGPKTLLFDCELLQVGMLFLTHIPTGNAIKGTGVGHVSLEPALLVGVRLGPNTYLQTELAEWIPLGGDPNYAGAILHYHGSLNHLLCHLLPQVPLLVTAEMNGWSFQDGAYTDPVLGSFQGASGFTYLSAGPGLRVVICDKMDFGCAAAFALTNPHFAVNSIRTEFRFRF